MYSVLLKNAKKFAENAHKGQKRKGKDTPFIEHIYSAINYVKQLTQDENIIAATFLHDTLEDTDTTIEDIKNNFNETIVSYVAHETEDKSLPWKERKQLQINSLKNATDKKVLIIAFSDKLANLKEMTEDYTGEKFWNRFNTKNPNDHYWYYNEFLNLFITNEEVFENKFIFKKLVEEYKMYLKYLFKVDI